MSNKSIFIYFCGLFLFSFNAAIAATDASSVTKASETKPAYRGVDEFDSNSKFSLGFKTDYSIQSQQQDNGDRTQQLSYHLTPGFALESYRASILLGYQQDLVDSTKNTFLDPSFSLSKKPWLLGQYFRLRPSASLTLPATDRSKNEINLLYNIGASLGLFLNTRRLNLDAWRIGVSLGVNRNFTQYATTASGEPSNAYRFIQRYEVSYDISDAISFSTVFDFMSNFSSGGTITDTFMHAEGFNYRFDDIMSFAISHSNRGPLLTPVTYEDNLKFFDKKASVYSLGINLRI